MKRPVMIVVSLAVTAALGMLGGAAIAAGPMLFSPAGVTPPAGIQAVPKDAPTYPANSSGETYGSAADAVSPETEPDLIQAVATNGEVGYVRKADLDRANGTEASATFKSPADALKWQETVGSVDQTIDVYARDGRTVIGTFTVVGTASQKSELAD